MAIISGVILCAIVIGGGGLVGQVARHRGRSFLLWSAIATLASAGAYLAFSIATSTPMASSALNTLGALAICLIPAVPHLVLAVLLKSMGTSTPRNRHTVFALEGLDDRSERELVIRDGEIHLAGPGNASDVIPLAAIDSVRADCECVRFA